MNGPRYARRPRHQVSVLTASVRAWLDHFTPAVLTRLGEETMGRVFDALQRAESAPSQTTSTEPIHRNGNPDNVAYFVPRNGHYHPWERAAFTGMPSAFNSASTAHTEEAT